jgi:competence ComEA-like helix-hairpin-helix protein
MWKDLFHLTKKERTGILVFFSLIVLVFSTKLFIPKKIPDEQPAPELFPEATTPERGQYRKSYPSDGTGRKNSNNYRETYTLRDFDPNTADSSTLRSLGLKPYIARNIVAYRNKGGKFRKPEDFARIHYLDPQKFEELRPYIKIASSNVQTRSFNDRAPTTPTTPTTPASPTTPKEEKQDSVRPFATKTFKYPLGTQVDVATADTTELKKIPHIGSFFAKNIVRYRQMLGGFYRVEQLQEVRGMTPERYEDILPWLKIGEEQISKLAVNSLSVERLEKHPYLSFYQAKAIVDLRRRRGRLQQINDIALLEEFTETDLQRLIPYLSFE